MQLQPAHRPVNTLRDRVAYNLVQLMRYVFDKVRSAQRHAALRTAGEARLPCVRAPLARAHLVPPGATPRRALATAATCP